MPQVDLQSPPETVRGGSRGDRGGLVRACHDLCEGGLAVAAAEMAFAGGIGADISAARRA